MRRILGKAEFFKIIIFFDLEFKIMKLYIMMELLYMINNSVLYQ